VVKKWSYSGILERSCASGADELMLEVLGAGTMFFDAKSGTKVDWASHCRLKETIGCPADQACRWSGQPCRYTVTVGKTTYRSCELDDGQGTRQLVASGAVTWKVAGEADRYFGVVSGVLIAASSQRLLALNPQTGATVWSLAGHLGSGLAAANGVLYLTLDDELISVDVKTGQSLARLHLADASR
jgi:outer membrane protein assembly factor BamB